ncbi:hypothetical protein [Mariprofundus ferrooxydans]|uniref:hypothetical protein n=1 Tax=Mariprofundus ferrooxydans TaxID=314344 RepID=UPI0003A22AF0|nr:hypothetical protein [Mariprofundus ferrooxydans]
MKTERLRTKLKCVSPLAVLLASVMCASQAQACATCGSTLSRNWETQGITATEGWSVDVTYDLLNQNKQRYGSSAASSARMAAITAAGGEVEDYTRTQTVTSNINYTGEAWGLSLQLPYVKRTHGTFGSAWPTGAQYLSSSASGVGDMRLLVHYSGFSADNSSGLIVGLKLPTGTNNTYFSDGVTPLDAGVQIGTGSTDTILGLYSFGAISDFGWFVQGTWQHAVATKTGLAGVTYRPGDAYAFNVGIRHSHFGDKFVPTVQFNVIKRNIDTGTGVPNDPITGVSVSGGTLVYVAPGATYRLGGGFMLHAFLQLPVYQKVNSLQLTPSYIFSFGMRYAF